MAIWIRRHDGVHVPLPQLAIDPGDLEWQEDARCREVDPEVWFPEKGQSSRPAKEICASCRVRVQCLEYALATNERYGVWGGKTDQERRQIRQQRADPTSREVTAA